MKTCPMCNATLDDAAQFCATCGANMNPAPAPDLNKDDAADATANAPADAEADATVCPQCGATPRDGDLFCQACGAPLNAAPASAPEDERFCTGCGAKIPADSNFCAICGLRAGDVPRYVPATSSDAATEVGDWLALSILSTIVIFPLGLGALIFSLMSRHALAEGHIAKARSYAEGAKIWNIVLWIVTIFFPLILLAVLAVVFGIAWIASIA